MPRFRSSLRRALRHTLWLPVLAGPIAGCSVIARPVPLPPQGPMHLVVSEGDAGFVIHAATPAAIPVEAAPPQAPVSLGNSVRIDRRAFIPTSTKDIPNGEDR